MSELVVQDELIESFPMPAPDCDGFEPEGTADGLAILLEAVSPQPRAPESPRSWVPPVPQSFSEIGVAESLIEELILKTVYARGSVIGRDLANDLCLRFSLIEPIIEALKRQRLIEAKASLGFGSISAVFGLSEAGRNRVKDCLEHNQYVGPVPVPIEQYNKGVRAQRLESGWLTEDILLDAYKGINVSDDILNQIGPAVNSGKSFLIYGQPGNGKTYLAEALFNLNSSPIYVPYALEYQGLIIKVYDPVYHHRIEQESGIASSISADERFDSRWIPCKRPFIVTGGELSISMLDLGYNETAKIYDAPFQLKANNGIYLIDDFGRQRATPAEVLNRWIVPMDRRVDFLSFQEGGKVEVPFETFLIFSTNLAPQQLGDEAFLRRIQYKMYLRNPNRGEFMDIFLAFARGKGLECDPELVERFIDRHYTTSGKKFRRCQPRDVLSHAIDLINYGRLEPVLTDSLLDRAFGSCFVCESFEE